MGHRPIIGAGSFFRRSGFTLIEVLVVTFILAAMIGFVTLQLTRSDSDLLKDEADRLATLLHSAHEEAILRGQLIAFEMQSGNYRFLYVEKETFAAFEQGPLSAQRFPSDISVRLEVEGRPAVNGRQRLIFDPSGALPSFRIGFSRRQADWWVQGSPDGKIRSLAKPDDKTS
jgi:general secretion pathway protein H